MHDEQLIAQTDFDEVLDALIGLMQFPSGQYSESDGFDEAWDRAHAVVEKFRPSAVGMEVCK